MKTPIYSTDTSDIQSDLCKDNWCWTQAAKDACDRMGHRKFYDQMIQDMIQHQKHRITDEVDITTLKDYMQVSQSFSDNIQYQTIIDIPRLGNNLAQCSVHIYVYLQYMSLLDETPSYMGGRENTWRKLTLDGE